MKIRLLHPWNVNPRRAIQIQDALRKKIRLRVPSGSWERIAAADVSYSRTDDRLFAAFLLFSYPDLVLLENASAQGQASFPYVPGLLSFREAPILIRAFRQLKTQPEMILFDGQGIAHPRSMGIAAHLGLIFDLPTIGCAKSRLIGTPAEPPRRLGSHVSLIEKGEIIGMIVRTRTGVKPVYVSPGHKMDLETSVKIVLSLCRGYRIPEPLRQAHLFVNRLRIEREQNHPGP
jgi:deoxyribonuclease V